MAAGPGGMVAGHGSLVARCDGIVNGRAGGGADRNRSSLTEAKKKSRPFRDTPGRGWRLPLVSPSQVLQYRGGRSCHPGQSPNPNPNKTHTQRGWVRPQNQGISGLTPPPPPGTILFSTKHNYGWNVIGAYAHHEEGDKGAQVRDCGDHRHGHWPATWQLRSVAQRTDDDQHGCECQHRRVELLREGDWWLQWHQGWGGEGGEGDGGVVGCLDSVGSTKIHQLV